MSSIHWDNLRGRSSNSPFTMGARGWKDVLTRVKTSVSEDRLSMISASMAYFLLLALVPALTSIVLIYALVNNPEEIQNQIAQFSQYLPAEVQTILKTQLTTLASKAHSTLSLSVITALLFSWYGASKAASAVIEAMNVIHDEKEKRSFLKLNMTSMGLTLAGSLFAMLAMLVVVGMPALLSLVDLGSELNRMIAGSSWIVLLFIFSLYLSTIYRFAPCRKSPKWRWVSWGAIFAAFLWAGVSLLFSWYASKFGNFNKTYGSLGAVIVLMMWFYISSYVILLGAEINAELEHQTLRDTTIGMAKPIGARGAAMANSIGKSSKHMGKAFKKWLQHTFSGFSRERAWP